MRFNKVILTVGVIASLGLAGCGNSAAQSTSTSAASVSTVSESSEQVTEKAVSATSEKAEESVKTDSASTSASSDSSETGLQSKPDIDEDSPEGVDHTKETPETADAPTAAPGTVDQTQLAEALAQVTSWGEGTSGSNLHAAQAAVSMLKWTNNASLADASIDDLQNGLVEAYMNMSEDDQQTFSANWGTVKDYADKILNDYDSVENDLKDAGVESDARKLAGNSDTKKNWTAFTDALSNNPLFG